jgi:hypothetical protein
MTPVSGSRYEPPPGVEITGGRYEPPPGVEVKRVSAYTRRPRSNGGADTRVADAVAELRKTKSLGMPRGVVEGAIGLLPAAASMVPGLGPVFGPPVGEVARQGLAGALGMGPSQPISGAIAGVRPGSLLSNAMSVVEQTFLGKLGTKIGPGIKVRGRTIIPGLEQVGRGVMRVSLGLTTPQARTAIKTGFTVAEKKLNSLLNRLGTIGERQLEIIRKAPPTVVFQTSDLAKHIDRTLIQPATRNMKSGETVAKLEKWTAEMLKDHPSGQMTAEELHIAAKLAREEANPILEKAGKGIQITQRDPWEQKWFKATVDFANDQLAGPKNLQGIRTGQGSQLGPVLGGKYARWNRLNSRLIDLKNRVLPIVKKQEQGGPLKQLISSVNPYTAGVVGSSLIAGGLGAAIPAGGWGQRTMQGLGGAVGGATLGLKAPQIALLLSNPQFARQMAMLQQTIGAAFTAPQGGPPVAP